MAGMRVKDRYKAIAGKNGWIDDAADNQLSETFSGLLLVFQYSYTFDLIKA